MPNSYITHFAQFNPLSYDELIKPVQSATAQHNALADSYAELEAMSSAIGENLDEQRDNLEYLRYRDYLNQIQSAAQGLLNKGIIGNPKAFDDARRARATYGSAIAPIAEQITARKEYIKNELDKKAKDPTYISTFDNPNDVSVSSFAHGNQPVDFGVSGNNLYALGKAATTAASAREIDLGAWSLDPNLLKQYFSRLETKGFSNEDILNVSPTLVADMAGWLANMGAEDYYKAEQDSSKLLSILKQSYYRIASENQLQNFNELGRPDLVNQANQWIMSGLIDGITYDKSDKQLKNDAYLNELQRAQLDKLKGEKLPEGPQIPLRATSTEFKDEDAIGKVNSIYNKYFNKESDIYVGDKDTFTTNFEQISDAPAGAYPTTPQFKTTGKSFNSVLEDILTDKEVPDTQRQRVEKVLNEAGLSLSDYKGQSFNEAITNIKDDLEDKLHGIVNTTYKFVVEGDEGSKLRDPVTASLKMNLSTDIFGTKRNGERKDKVKESSNDVIKKIDGRTGKPLADNGIKTSKDFDDVMDNIETYGISAINFDFSGVIKDGQIDYNKLTDVFNNYATDIANMKFVTAKTSSGDIYKIDSKYLDTASQSEIAGMMDALYSNANYLTTRIEEDLMSAYIKEYQKDPTATKHQLAKRAEKAVAELYNSYMITADANGNPSVVKMPMFYGLATNDIGDSMGRNFNQVQGLTNSNE